MGVMVTNRVKATNQMIPVGDTGGGQVSLLRLFLLKDKYFYT